MELGEKIQISRKKKGMSQEDLANVLNVSRQAVQKWESGVSNPELNKVIELGRVLDVSLDWLLDENKILKEEAVVEEETEDSLEEEIEPIEEETPTEEEQENPTHKETPVPEKPKHSFKKVFIIGSIALLLIGGGTAAAIAIAVNAKKRVDMPFIGRENSFLVEGYEGTKEIDGVSYAFGKVGADKSMYIVGVETSNPSFMAEYNGYVLEDMLFET
ncbi:MAG: helix-turn-helix transcriptional regulator, partial [Bacilli bacterium]|nr:helix-turn-helix transcriptional regulator [Bacilli bacterium]